MPSFDVGTFAQQIVGPLHDLASQNAGKLKSQAAALKTRIDQLETDTKNTLAAIQGAEVFEARSRLRDDLDTILPARRDAILSIVASTLGSDGEAMFDAALQVVIKAGIAAAIAFL